MTLARLIYVSTLSKTCDALALEDILRVSRQHNEERKITGLLSHNSEYFLQCLEGDRDELSETYNHIINDSRHSNVTITYYKEIYSRQFGDWSMGEVPQTHLTSLLNLQFSGTDEFKPYELTGKSAYLMLVALKQHLPSE